MATLGTLASGIRSISAVRRSEVYLTELGDDDRPLVNGEGGAQWRKFQYFPESFSDTKQVNYQTKDVPGGSLPLYQYSGSGSRVIAFTAQFSTDVDHLANQQTVDFNAPVGANMGDQTLPVNTTTRIRTIDGAVESAYTRLSAEGVRDRNPYIPGMLVWLRRFLFPRYGENSEIGVPLTKPPHKLLLNIPGSEIELYGGTDGFSVRGGGILCIMTQCDITIDAMFPSGNIRSATVNLSFAESAQRAGAVRFPSAGGMDAYLRWHRMVATGTTSSSGTRR